MFWFDETGIGETFFKAYRKLQKSSIFNSFMKCEVAKQTEVSTAQQIKGTLFNQIIVSNQLA